jgi:hypothetical protein
MKEFKKGIEANYNLNLYESKNEELKEKIKNNLKKFNDIKIKCQEEIREKDKKLEEKEKELDQLNKEAIELSSEVKKDMKEMQKDFDKLFEFRKNQSLDYLDKKIKKLEKIKNLKKEISLQNFNSKNNNFILKNEYKEKLINKNIEYLNIKKERQKEINDLIIEKNKIILSARKQAYEEKMNYLKNKKNYIPKNNYRYEKQIRNLENRINKVKNKKVYTKGEYKKYMNDKQNLESEKLFNNKYQYLFNYRGGSPNYCYAHNIPKGSKNINPSNITFGEYLKKQLTKDKIFNEFFNSFSRVRVTDQLNLDSVCKTIIKGLLVNNEL